MRAPEPATGTRVPVDTVTSSLAAGAHSDLLRISWPFLTDEILEDALLHAKRHPRCGRPRRFEPSAGARGVSRKVVSPGVPGGSEWPDE